MLFISFVYVENGEDGVSRISQSTMHQKRQLMFDLLIQLKRRSMGINKSII